VTAHPPFVLSFVNQFEVLCARLILRTTLAAVVRSSRPATAAGLALTPLALGGGKTGSENTE